MPTLYRTLPIPFDSRATGVQRRTRLTVAILPAALVATACGAATSAAGPSPSRAAEIEAIYRARIDSARGRFTEADVRFMTAMLGHHAQGRHMVELAVNQGDRREVRRLAMRLLSNYEHELTVIRQWLRDRELTVLPGGVILADGPEYVSYPPGMLTSQEMEDLEQAAGAEFDRLFLTHSIQHHLAAVELVRSLRNSDGAAQDQTVFQIATSVRGEHAAYVARMERMLRRLALGDPHVHALP